MPMSRRFYRKLADNLKATKPNPDHYDGPVETERFNEAASVWASTVVGVISAIEEEAPSFDKVRFAEAAGIPLSASV